MWYYDGTCAWISEKEAGRVTNRVGHAYAEYANAEAQKPLKRASIALRKVFARPESFCAYDRNFHLKKSNLPG